ncbi:class II histone deacetylase [Ruegeria pomeroyi]|uniref:Histone deacetylase family protein n=2 Tax=Ruegeria pomeroyi TaxID=89184 RepID=Q5LNK8_RUEPO|nr:class II histone deacetylase [Ruegeria pomeroyi]HCE70843.1 class II histone deacetylase [Ruegeria sp.]AAV96430.1 histone deacetylase family protein [Ruegeria pomeroyi DSS-3]NVK95663.1 class II histone deacetylase [Ruegeria pomeroyi]NVL01320.1 class II histone deacetylase [Ruegeria pomeroyi]QWV09977.1 class II histone deacetylase [Ruegeria pomeroyi]
MGKTAFISNEKCFWHFGGNYALLAPVGGLVQPMVAGGLPEAPETKRRLKNLIEVTGLHSDLEMVTGGSATIEDVLRVHPRSYIDEFRRLSDSGGGELGLRTPFGPGAFEIAMLSAGLVIDAVEGVVQGRYRNAYALSRPPGHHCLPDWPNGFCLLANIAIAIEAAKAKGLLGKVAVLDWDVHHGNGTEAIYYERDDVLTISIHQDRCYPHDTGSIDDQGKGAGLGFNMNIPLPPGCGHNAYVEATERLIIPKLKAFDADLVIIACGFDAGGFDPLARMMCSAETFREMTRRVMQVSDGKLVAAHEGGYSELYVPFCGHAMLEEMSGSTIHAADPLAQRVMGQQPGERVQAFHSELIDDMVAKLL